MLTPTPLWHPTVKNPGNAPAYNQFDFPLYLQAIVRDTDILKKGGSIFTDYAWAG